MLSLFQESTVRQKPRAKVIKYNDLVATFKQILNWGFQFLFPLFLGSAILWWVYRDFDLLHAWHVMLTDMAWEWMLLSLAFGILSHIIRGLRWKLTLAPLHEYPKTVNCVNAIFLSYAANLVVPRIGEISRCGVLSRYDRISFSKSLGTVVTERLIDSICVLLITGFTMIIKADTFISFFDQTGTNMDSVNKWLTSMNFYIIVLCVVAILILLYFIIRRLAVFNKVKGVIGNIWEGIVSLRHVEHPPLFFLYTVAIWLFYFLQFYVSIFCFSFTTHLGIDNVLLLFVVGSIAVVVPTPNGAGPWHFAIITMLGLLGIGKEDAGIFALITHGMQTFLLILLGIYAVAALPITNTKFKIKTL